MLTSLNLKNFRGFKEFMMPGLARVNLITGKNNTGKTALLEAIYLCCQHRVDPANFHKMFRSAAKTTGEPDFWEWLLSKHQPTQDADIEAELADGDKYSVYLRRGAGQRGAYDSVLIQMPSMRVLQKGGPGVQAPSTKPQIISLSTHPTAPTLDAAGYIAAAKKKGGEERIENLLREVEPRLEKVRAFQIEGSNNSLVYADIGLQDLIPATQLGQGFNRLLKIYSAILVADNQICLIDEIENGLHHSVLREVWKGLAALARQENVQIFATTHSWECAVAAHEVFREHEPYDFALHRLERVNGEIQALTYDKETLDAVDALEMEVR